MGLNDEEEEEEVEEEELVSDSISDDYSWRKFYFLFLKKWKYKNYINLPN